jgi:hypothetical protein
MLPASLLTPPEPPGFSLFDASRSYQSAASVRTPIRPIQSPPAAPQIDEDLDGLPVRVRQANLAPQLSSTRLKQDPETSARSPRELLDLMTSMQEGWRQGRREAEGDQDVRNERDSHG